MSMKAVGWLSAKLGVNISGRESTDYDHGENGFAAHQSTTSPIELTTEHSSAFPSTSEDVFYSPNEPHRDNGRGDDFFAGATGASGGEEGSVGRYLKQASSVVSQYWNNLTAGGGTSNLGANLAGLVGNGPGSQPGVSGGRGTDPNARENTEVDENGLPVSKNWYYYNKELGRWDVTPEAPENIKREHAMKLREAEEERLGLKKVAPPPPPPPPGSALAARGAGVGVPSGPPQGMFGGGQRAPGPHYAVPDFFNSAPQALQPQPQPQPQPNARQLSPTAQPIFQQPSAPPPPQQVNPPQLSQSQRNPYSPPPQQQQQGSLVQGYQSSISPTSAVASAGLYGNAAQTLRQEQLQPPPPPSSSAVASGNFVGYPSAPGALQFPAAHASSHQSHQSNSNNSSKHVPAFCPSPSSQHSSPGRAPLPVPSYQQQPPPQQSQERVGTLTQELPAFQKPSSVSGIDNDGSSRSRPVGSARDDSAATAADSLFGGPSQPASLQAQPLPSQSPTQPGGVVAQSPQQPTVASFMQPPPPQSPQQTLPPPPQQQQQQQQQPESPQMPLPPTQPSPSPYAPNAAAVGPGTGGLYHQPPKSALGGATGQLANRYAMPPSMGAVSSSPTAAVMPGEQRPVASPLFQPQPLTQSPQQPSAANPFSSAAQPPVQKSQQWQQPPPPSSAAFTKAAAPPTPSAPMTEVRAVQPPPPPPPSFKPFQPK